MESDELIALIERAFPTYPLPEVTFRQVTLSDEGIRRGISDEEWERAGRIDRDVPWTELSDNDLIECQIGVAHLTKPGFAYYLAALLRFAIRHSDASILTREGHLVGTILYTVTKRSGVAANYVRARWDSLTAQQKEVVRRFLEYVVAHSEAYRLDASRGLARYWSAAAQQSD